MVIRSPTGLAFGQYCRAMAWLMIVTPGAPVVSCSVNVRPRSSGIPCQVQADASAADLAARSADVATCLYRVAQESLTNVVKHSRATEVAIDLLADGPDELLLRVRDNGSGLDLDSRRKPDSFGLLGMQERLRRLSGTLEVHSQAGSGATVEARVPVPALTKESRS